MAETPTSAPSSSGSYSDVDMRDMAEWQVEVTKTFKVSELDEFLRAKSKTVKGMKAHKAMEVAWCYTKEEIAEWRRQRKTIEPAALMVNRDSRKRTLDDFLRRCCHEYVKEYPEGPRDNGEYTERCRLCGNVR